MSASEKKGHDEALERAKAHALEVRRAGHGHGFEGPLRSKVKGGAHTKAALKRSGSPQGDRIGERSRGLS
ncbi:hypothetical protein ACN20G_14725 [Streptomyces sp. BI20]|uniref:hypothetical protein n=1 Tax=Streptomyces sp. BI20 TaxID=3403460 RepID=UPI003C70BD70